MCNSGAGSALLVAEDFKATRVGTARMHFNLRIIISLKIKNSFFKNNITQENMRFSLSQSLRAFFNL